jgi:hypothetical protein
LTLVEIITIVHMATPIPSTLHWRPLPTSPNIDSTTSTVISVENPNSNPCRRCLKDGQVGEKMHLLSYDPWLGPSPYRQSGPIYIHAEPKCELVELNADDAVPEQQRRRLLSVRAFDKNHMMVEYDVVKGEHLIESAEKLFGNYEAEYLHVHNAGPGESSSTRIFSLACLGDWQVLLFQRRAKTYLHPRHPLTLLPKVVLLLGLIARSSLGILESCASVRTSRASSDDHSLRMLYRFYPCQNLN